MKNEKQYAQRHSKSSEMLDSLRQLPAQPESKMSKKTKMSLVKQNLNQAGCPLMAMVSLRPLEGQGMSRIRTAGTSLSGMSHLLQNEMIM